MARKRQKAERDFEDLSSYSSTKEYKKRRKNRKGLTLASVTALAVCAVAIVTGCVMMYISTHLSERATTTAITKDPDKLGIGAAATSSESVLNIAMFGVDARSDDFTGPSDAIMILTVDYKHNKIKMTSILRDSRVSIEGQTLGGERIDWETKISAAYEQGGPELAIRTLNRNFNLDITDYVTVNFSSLAEIVDILGGVDIRLTAEEVREINVNLWTLTQEVEAQRELDQASGAGDGKGYPQVRQEDYLPDASGEININSGNYVGGLFHLNGNQAVAYGRIRGAGSDTLRVDRQQVVFSQMVRQALSMGQSDYAGLARQLLPHCATSLDLSGVMALTPILASSPSLESIKVPDPAYETDLVEGAGEDGITYDIYSAAQAAQRISAFIYEEDSPYWDSIGDTGRDGERQGSSD